MTLYTKGNKFKGQSTSNTKITSRTVCGICGGLGHYGSINGKECLTKRLGVKVSKDILTQIRYPDGIRYPFQNAPGSSSQHSNVVKSSKGPHPKVRKGKRTYSNSKRRVYLVESGSSSGSDHNVNKSESKDGINVAQQVQSGSESDVEIGKFAVAYHTITTSKSKYESYSSDGDDDQ